MRLTRRPIVLAFPRTLRTLPVRSLLVVALVAVAPTALTVARAGHDLHVATVVAALVGGAGLAYALDDDARALLASSPSTLAERRAARVLAGSLVVGAAWVAVWALAGAASLTAGLAPRDLAIDALAASGLAVGTASAAQRSGTADHVGFVGLVAAVTTMAVVTALAQRITWLPSLAGGPTHGRWLWVAAASWSWVCWTSRDPATRSCLLRHR